MRDDTQSETPHDSMINMIPQPSRKMHFSNEAKVSCASCHHAREPVEILLSPEASEIVASIPQPVTAAVHPDAERPGRFILTLTPAEP